jgi:hypothetical protein
MARGRMADQPIVKVVLLSLERVWCRCVLTHFLLSFHPCPDAPQIRE